MCSISAIFERTSEVSNERARTEKECTEYISAFFKTIEMIFKHAEFLVVRTVGTNNAFLIYKVSQKSRNEFKTSYLLIYIS